MGNTLFGLSDTFVGLLLAVIGVALLVLCVMAYRLSGRQQRETLHAAPAEAPAVTLPEQSAPHDAIAPEVIAAITAAIAAVWQKDAGFVVRRIRRIHNAPAWNRAGRDDQIYSRL